MKVGFVGVHYPHTEHRQEFLSRARQVVEFLRTAPGCLSADSWTTANGEVVVTTGQWESHEAASASASSPMSR
jgi:quinol monooxygenase YgiN